MNKTGLFFGILWIIILLIDIFLQRSLADEIKFRFISMDILIIFLEFNQKRGDK